MTKHILYSYVTIIYSNLLDYFLQLFRQVYNIACGFSPLGLILSLIRQITESSWFLKTFFLFRLDCSSTKSK